MCEILCTVLMWRKQPTPNQRLNLTPLNAKFSCASSALVPKPKLVQELPQIKVCLHYAKNTEKTVIDS